MKNPYLTGNNIYLRPLELTDLERFTNHRNNEACRYTFSEHVLRPTSHLEAEKTIRFLIDSQDIIPFAICIKESDKYIGFAGFSRINSIDCNAEFFIYIGDEKEWNKGYATEVTKLMLEYGFNTLNLFKVWLSYVDGNVAGKKAYQKCGFSEEGVLRQHVFRNGKYHDFILMGLLVDDYKRMKASGNLR